MSCPTCRFGRLLSWTCRKAGGLMNLICRHRLEIKDNEWFMLWKRIAQSRQVVCSFSPAADTDLPKRQCAILVSNCI